MLRYAKLLTILGIIGLLLLIPNGYATVQVTQYFTHTPVSVCQPSDANSNCGGSSSGNVGIGTAGWNAYYPANGSTITASNVIFTASSGNVGIGSLSPGQALDVQGTTRTTNLIDTGLTASQLTATDINSQLQSLTTATYPSLTELAYVKGVTSAIQTQLNGKQANLSLTPGTYSDGKFCTYTSSGTVLNCNSSAGSGTVTSVTCGTGLSGGTFTTSGTCAVNATQAITNISGLTFNGPVYTSGGNGTLNTGTYAGNSTVFQMNNGTLTSGNLTKADANQNVVDGGVNAKLIAYIAWITEGSQGGAQ